MAIALNYSPAIIQSAHAQELPAGWRTPTYEPATEYFCATTDQGRKCYAEAEEAVSYFRTRLARVTQVQPAPEQRTLERMPEPRAEPPLPEYLQRWKLDQEWRHQVQQEQQQQPVEEKTASGCGTTCTVIGGLVAAVSGGLLIAVLDEWEEQQKNVDKYGQDPRKPQGPVLLGVATAAGLGLMLYGIATTK